MWITIFLNSSNGAAIHQTSNYPWSRIKSISNIVILTQSQCSCYLATIIFAFPNEVCVREHAIRFLLDLLRSSSHVFSSFIDAAKVATGFATHFFQHNFSSPSNKACTSKCNHVLNVSFVTFQVTDQIWTFGSAAWLQFVELRCRSCEAMSSFEAIAPGWI